MRPVEPLPLNHSWPLAALHEHLAPVALDSSIARSDVALAERGIGLWRCDLADDSLSWTCGVYDIFGIERDSEISRAFAASRYLSESRDAMERLRAYAIRHRRGFTLDVDICRVDGGHCAMRLIAAPVLEGDEVVALFGVKQMLAPDAAPSCRLDPTIFVML
ncbi:PAS domain-containing protein [Sphingobium fontiphilum]|uniref:PAS domain-containing protein n=1 Tax=Sphingobium fontiphilum TaxID=944425 RepID=A0A7W6DI21_9SPHN|nr:diguanylate cyclase [Sphingobium fontiphilum]MBB3983423.1 PAS domain-containing protein [Sphingobium fontiphilum]